MLTNSCGAFTYTERQPPKLQNGTTILQPLPDLYRLTGCPEDAKTTFSKGKKKKKSTLNT